MGTVTLSKNIPGCYLFFFSLQ